MADEYAAAGIGTVASVLLTLTQARVLKQQLTAQAEPGYQLG